MALWPGRNEAAGVESLTPEETGALGLFRRRLLDLCGEAVLDMRLFGSKARRDAGPESDLDVAVVVADEEHERLERIAWDLASEVMNETGCPTWLQVLVLPRSRFNDLKRKRALLYRSIRDEGLPMLLREDGVSWEDGGDVPAVGRDDDVELELARAREALAAAGHLLGHGSLAGAASRAYYAAFHAMSAVLLHDGIERARHRGVLMAFRNDVCNPGKMPVRLAQAADWLAGLRLRADYERHAFISHEEVVEAIEAAGEIVAAVERKIGS